MSFQGDSIFWVEVEKIVPNPFQPRREFDESKLKELADSIRMYGILQPLTVTRKEIPRPDGSFHTEYELIAGERRLRASKLAGIEQVPVIIRSGEQTEQEKLELAIIENLQREDLNAVDRALAFQQLAQVFELSHTEVAKKVGRSREYVSNTIRLLGLPEYMLSSLRVADISEGHARTLLMLKERPEEQDVVYREILLKKLSVREVERIARKIASDKVRKKNWEGTDTHLIEIERAFTDTLGTRVQIQKTDFGGKLTIDYFSEEDLQKILLIVSSQGKITDFHKAESDEGNDSVVVIQKMSEAVPLMAVAGAVASAVNHIDEAKEPIIPETDPEPTASTIPNTEIDNLTEDTVLTDQVEQLEGEAFAPGAVPSESGAVPSPVNDTDRLRALLASEEAVSESLEDMVLQKAGYNTPEEPIEDEFETAEEVPEFKVPESEYKATMREAPPEADAPVASPQVDQRSYQYEEQRWEYVAPDTTKEVPVGPSVSEQTSVETVTHSTAPAPTPQREKQTVEATVAPKTAPLEKKDNNDDDSAMYTIRNFSL